MTLNKKFLIDLIGLLLIALVVVVGYKLSPLLLPQADLSLAPDPACDLQKAACRFALPGGGQLTVDVAQRPIPLVRAFALEVKVSDRRVERVEVDFAGVDMSMGLNRPQLQAGPDGVFRGEATLPVCVTGRMSWQATVLLGAADARIAVPLRFTTGETDHAG